MNKIALVSVSNKNKLIKICKELEKNNIKIISTGNTFKTIKKSNCKAYKIESITKSKELLEGRVKTLHPKIHGGILYKRKNDKHLLDVEKNKLPPIDFVIVNLYQFKKYINIKRTYEECIENIDIGGHTLIRSAAKNFKDVTVICDTKDYEEFIKNLKENMGNTSLKFRKKMAIKAFRVTQKYDQEIIKWFTNYGPKKNQLIETKLRYGENPHQKASVFLKKNLVGPLNCKQLSGKKLSYNNILDINAAIMCLLEFSKPTTVIVKHTNPCCVACRSNITDAFNKALECDPQSAFGGIVSMNREINKKLAQKISTMFFEIIIAPNYSDESKKILEKKNLILLKSNSIKKNNLKETKSIYGGFLKQEEDNIVLKKGKLHCVTKIKVGNKTLQDLIFSFTVCKHIKSNAIVLGKNQQTIGIGAGQMSRLDSIKIAISKMNKFFKNKRNYVLASDAFFPFQDNISILKNKGCRAIIQPGGSKKDNQIVAKTNLLKMSMYFAKIRHFKH